MANMTDPARELADIASRFDGNSSLRADQVIQLATGFEPWSTEIYTLISCILERADLIKRILPRSQLDQDLIGGALQDVDDFKKAFLPNAIMAASNHGGSTAQILRAQARPMQYLSIAVRQFESYPRYSTQEASELVALIDEYILHLETHGDALSFVKAAIKEGMAVLRFRLNNVDWLGSGYALQSLREAMFVYREVSEDVGLMKNPDAEAFVKGFGTVLKRVLDVVKSAKDYSEAASWGYTIARLSAPAAAGYLLAAPK